MATLFEIVETTLAAEKPRAEAAKQKKIDDNNRKEAERTRVHDSLDESLPTLNEKYGLVVEQQGDDSYWSLYLNGNGSKTQKAYVYTFTPWDGKVHWKVPGTPGPGHENENESYPDKFAENFGVALAKWIAKESV